MHGGSTITSVWCWDQWRTGKTCFLITSSPLALFPSYTSSPVPSSPVPLLHLITSSPLTPHHQFPSYTSSPVPLLHLITSSPLTPHRQFPSYTSSPVPLLHLITSFISCMCISDVIIVSCTLCHYNRHYN